MKGKEVIVLEEVVSRGKRMEELRRKLEGGGGYVEREMFLGGRIEEEGIRKRGVLEEMGEGFYEGVGE